MSNIINEEEIIKATFRDFISQQILPLARTAPINDEDSFLENGILDSTGMLELVNFIEKRYSIRIDGDELIPDNLDSVNKLLIFVEKKKKLCQKQPQP
jgi:acyl carrier protein